MRNQRWVLQTTETHFAKGAVLWVWFLLLIMGLHPRLLSAQEYYCAHDVVPHAPSYSAASKQMQMPIIPTNGRFRAIAVFFRFADDTAIDNGPCPRSQQWSDPDVLPAFANTVLSASPDPTFDESSLTAYYFEQSQGEFTLYGDFYPQVVVTNLDEADYAVGATTELDRGMLTQEILGRIDADPTFDLSNYDENGDGVIDHVFFIIRRLNTLSIAGGAAGISNIGYTSPNPEYGSGTLLEVDAELSGSYNRWSEAGNIIPEVDHTRLLAHEFGHDMWENSILNGGHIPRIGGANGVPANGTNRLGYALMAGGTADETRGDETISAWERDILRDDAGNPAMWINCPLLTADATILLTDLYSDNTSNCRRLEVPNGAITRDVYLSNRQRIDFFDVLRTSACTTPPNDQGLMTTGLLVTLAEGARMAIAPADNTLDLSSQAAVYQGDLFEPGTAIQITPWTRPNINGFTTYPATFTMQPGNWQAIDDIRFSGAPNNEMAFDYIEDFRTQPTIREDSWIGDETDGFTFVDALTVTNESILTLEANTLTFQDDVLIDDHSQIIQADGDIAVSTGIIFTLEDAPIRDDANTMRIEAGATTTFEDGSTLDIGQYAILEVLGVPDGVEDNNDGLLTLEDGVLLNFAGTCAELISTDEGRIEVLDAATLSMVCACTLPRHGGLFHLAAGQSLTYLNGAFLANDDGTYRFEDNTTIQVESSAQPLLITPGSAFALGSGASFQIKNDPNDTQNLVGNVGDPITFTGGEVIFDGSKADLAHVDFNDTALRVQNGADVTIYTDGEPVVLGPGFQTDLGSTFKVVLDSAPPPTPPPGATSLATTQARTVAAGASSVPSSVQRAGEAERHNQAAVEAVADAVPETFALSQNYPNPFTTITTIPYALQEAAQVRLTIYNVLGQQVVTLVDGFERAGNKSVVWTGHDASGKLVPSGTYLYRLETPAGSFTQRMLLVR